MTENKDLQEMIISLREAIKDKDERIFALKERIDKIEFELSKYKNRT